MVLASARGIGEGELDLVIGRKKAAILQFLPALIGDVRVLEDEPGDGRELGEILVVGLPRLGEIDQLADGDVTLGGRVVGFGRPRGAGAGGARRRAGR